MNQLTLSAVDNGFCRVVYSLGEHRKQRVCYQEEMHGEFEFYLMSGGVPFDEPMGVIDHKPFIRLTPLPRGNSHIEKLLRRWLVKQVTSDVATEMRDYFARNRGEPTEFDMEINDISRRIIRRIHDVYGECYLVNVNLRGDAARNRDAVAVKYQAGENCNAFNFCADLATPMISEELIDLVMEWNDGGQSMSLLNKIFCCAQDLGAKALTWA